MEKMKIFLRVGVFGLLLILSRCNVSANLNGNLSTSSSATQYSLGGVVLGLGVGQTVVLQNNSTDNTLIVGGGTGNDAFTFATKLSTGVSYYVTVLSQPVGKTCVAGGNLGSVGTSNIATIQVTCSSITTYTVGGSITNLVGTGLLLKNLINGVTTDLTVATGVAYNFPTTLTSTNTYSVTVVSQPTAPSQNCAVAAPTGTIASANITNVNITCTTNTYTIGGTISGLALGDTITLSDGAATLPILGTGVNQPFTFPIAKADATAYNVVVSIPPAGKTCTVTNAAGTLAGANVTNVFITCSGGGLLTVGGATALTGVTGLATNATIVLGLTSTTGASESLSITNSGALASVPFTFLNKFATGASVTVNIAQQPLNPHQTCTFPAAALTTGPIVVGAVNVALPLITCTTNTYAVAGTISGVAIGDIVGLQLTSTTNGVANAVQNTSVTAAATSAPFSFLTPVADGSSYTVTVTSFSGAVYKTCGAPVTGVLNGAPAISIVCAAGPTVSVSFSGLFTGESLGLQLNGSTTSTVVAAGTAAGTGTVTFTTPVLIAGDNYSVAISQQPTRLNGSTLDYQCFLSPNATGVMPVVGTITATCSPLAYSVAGNITGLAVGEQAVIYDNTAKIGQIIHGNGLGTDTYSMPPVNDGTDINIDAMQSPPGKTCVFSNGMINLKSTIWGAVQKQDVACTAAATASVSITVINLTGANTLNVTNTTSVPSTQTVPLTSANNKIPLAMTAQAVNSTFSLTLTQPATQTCVFVTGSASGTMTSAGNAVVIDCANPAKPDFTIALNSISVGGGGIIVSYTLSNIGSKTAVNPKVALRGKSRGCTNRSNCDPDCYIHSVWDYTDKYSSNPIAGFTYWSFNYRHSLRLC